MPVDPGELSGLPLFDGLTSVELEEVASHLDADAMAAKQPVIQEGDPPKHPIYVLFSGSVEVVKRGLDGRCHLISTLTAPSVFGEIEALSKRPAIAGVNTVTAVRLAYLRRGVFDELCATHSSAILKIVKNLAMVLSHRLAATDERLAASFDVGDPAQRQRIAQVREVLYAEWRRF